MNISHTIVKGRVPVTIFRLEGKFDTSTYRSAVQEAEELYKSGIRDMIIDMGGVSYISSSGLMALHTIALMFRENKEQAKPGGFQAINMERDKAVQQHIKLLNLPEQTRSVLDMVGLLDFFQTFTDLDSAVNSF